MYVLLLLLLLAAALYAWCSIWPDDAACIAPHRIHDMVSHGMASHRPNLPALYLHASGACNAAVTYRLPAPLWHSPSRFETAPSIDRRATQKALLHVKDKPKRRKEPLHSALHSPRHAPFGSPVRTQEREREREEKKSISWS
ncbi:hypothetical protein M441DRAFT_368560 [Trichoderma asperellum CBS 433.97]|uniref:Secreted protein n=1 Tax=Trichoderma asperellum (strain ATCC 204424 / CBS 433.97 / NBRC 101777) TaxID=1042311 RepID=A0A2T3ZEL8_TRIA4|nr:hypothetical protein M441DRAFT_368560 [Trichoderma asperellum CBS 433.97]PTB43245.1 hypothetical protein M441DRAFT_368560 [Trichoderma asperellum CBS 433.97]